MREQVLNSANAFRGINDLAMKGEIVVFGSTYMAGFPFYELVNRSQLEHAVYNRSIPDITLEEALELLPVCVLALRPSKVFLQLGEGETSDPHASERYRRVVTRLRQELPETKVYLIGVQGTDATPFNQQLATLCDNKTVFGISLSSHGYKGQFRELSCFFRSRPITFPEAFAIAAL